jgi:hypothetical protein
MVKTVVLVVVRHGTHKQAQVVLPVQETLHLPFHRKAITVEQYLQMMMALAAVVLVE